METTTETVNKTTVVEVVKEADVVNRQEVKGTTDIVFIVDKSGSMDSHITDVANNIEKFVRDLESKNVQARLGLVDYESSKNTTYHDFGGSKFTTDTNAFVGKLKAILLAQTRKQQQHYHILQLHLIILGELVKTIVASPSWSLTKISTLLQKRQLKMLH